MQLDFKCSLAMVRFMRLAYCRGVIVDVEELPLLRAPQPASDVTAFRTELERLFVDLAAQEIVVGSLTVAGRTERIADLVTCKEFGRFPLPQAKEKKLLELTWFSA